MPSRKDDGAGRVTEFPGTARAESSAVASGTRIYIVFQEVDCADVVVGVFSTEKRAEEYCGHFGYHELRIAAFFVDFRQEDTPNAA